MDNILGTEFEISLRYILLLDIAEDYPMTETRLCALDFIATYAADFNYSDENLHGISSYRFSEYLHRQMEAKAAIKSLVLTGLAKVKANKQGFFYSLSRTGKEKAPLLKSDYANEYWNIACVLFDDTRNMSDTQLSALIHRKMNDSLEEMRIDK